MRNDLDYFGTLNKIDVNNCKLNFLEFDFHLAIYAYSKFAHSRVGKSA